MLADGSRSTSDRLFGAARRAVAVVALLHAPPALSVITIDRLPFECDSAGETYVLGGDLALDQGDAIVVTADKVTVDGGGHTITYANSGPGFGIHIATHVTGLEIRNLTLIQGAYEPKSGEKVHGIYRNGNHAGVKIHHNTIRINHTGAVPNAEGAAISLSNNRSDSTGNEIYANVLTVSGTSLGAAIDVGAAGSARWVGRIYRNKITMSKVGSHPAGYPRALALGGRGPVEVYENQITLDASASTIQGISLWNGSGFSIHHNTITTAANQARAILIDGDSDNNLVFRNKIVMTAQTATGDASAGVRIRYGSDNNVVHSNDIDASTALNSYPIRLGGEDTRGGRFPRLTPPKGTILHHNTLKSRSLAVDLYDNAGPTHFYQNTIAGVGPEAHAIYLNGDFPSVSFSHDVITNASNPAAAVRLQDGSSKISFCGTNLTRANVSVGTGRHQLEFPPGECRTPKSSDRQSPRQAPVTPP